METIHTFRIGAAAAKAAGVHALVSDKIAEIDNKIALLDTMRQALQVTAESCDCGGDLSRCDVLAGLQDPI